MPCPESIVELTAKQMPPEAFDKRATDRGQVVFHAIAFIEATPRYAVVTSLCEGKCKAGVVGWEDWRTAGYIFGNDTMTRVPVNVGQCL